MFSSPSGGGPDHGSASTMFRGSRSVTSLFEASSTQENDANSQKAGAPCSPPWQGNDTNAKRNVSVRAPGPESAILERRASTLWQEATERAAGIALPVPFTNQAGQSPYAKDALKRAASSL